MNKKFGYSIMAGNPGYNYSSKTVLILDADKADFLTSNPCAGEVKNDAFDFFQITTRTKCILDTTY